MACCKRRAGFALLNPSKLIFFARENARHQHPKLWLAGWLAGSSTGWLALADWLWLAGAGRLALVWLALVGLAGNLAPTGSCPRRILQTGWRLGGSGQLAGKVAGWRLCTLCACVALGPSLFPKF